MTRLDPASPTALASQADFSRCTTSPFHRQCYCRICTWCSRKMTCEGDMSRAFAWPQKQKGG